MKNIVIYIIIAGLSMLIVHCSTKAKNSVPGTNTQNIVINPGFEEPFESAWKFANVLGGEGSVSLTSDVKRSGKQAVKLSKTNSFGYVQLSSVKPVRVEAGITYTFRFRFNSSNSQVTSFLIPRIVVDNNTPAIANPNSALWVDFDYDSQSLMRNSATTKPEDWVKRIVFYENKTDSAQEVYLQVMLYGNPFDVYVDDFEFVAGKVIGVKEPKKPGFNFTEEQVLKILAGRKEETASVSGSEGTTHFYLNGKESWPVYYRACDGKNDWSNPAGFAAQGVEINNVQLKVIDGPYNWEKHRAALMNILRRNPNAKLLLDMVMDPDKEWIKQNPDDNWETKNGKKNNECSYSSLEWRKAGDKNIRLLIGDMKKEGFWKIVIGVQVDGGHDWQFWTKPIGEYAADYAPGHRRAWQAWLEKQYKDIKSLNTVWGSTYHQFSEIPIADPTTEHETYPAIMPKGAVPDYRQFSEAIAFDLREFFARSIKKEAGKPVVVSAYGMPMENQHEFFLKMAGKKGKANDMIASMSYYPYRQPGFASGYHPEQSFGYHNVGFMQELDLRYFTSDADKFYDELALMWVGSQLNIKDWRNMHRKLVGISLAQNQGYWYYDMNKQFLEIEVLDEIGKVKKIADTLVTRKGVEFRPDVCLVRFGAESRYYGSSVDNAVGATVQWQYMMLETSGVPFDVHYLSDVMAEPSLQKYKVYIFHNNTYLSASEKEWITKNLKNNQRTIIWMYDAGYASEKGLSTDNLSELTGMKVGTTEGYTRSTAAMVVKDKLAGGAEGYLKIPEFQGMAEAFCSIFTTSGLAQLLNPYISKWGYTVVPGVSRYQKFRIESGYDNALASYREDGKTAMAVKRFPDWTSIYIAAPNALAGEMMNNIAKEAGAYRCGPAAMGELRMSGRFASYHALRSGKYDFQLPKGASKVIDPESGKVLADGVKIFTIHGKAQTTYWFFIE